jgi:hypothetical protein
MAINFVKYLADNFLLNLIQGIVGLCQVIFSEPLV